MLVLRNKLFSPGVGGESLDNLKRLYENNIAANPEFANSSRGQKLMERIKYEQGYVKPTPNVPATIQKPISNIPTPQKPTVKPIPKIGTAGKLLGSAAIIGTSILAANALINKK